MIAPRVARHKLTQKQNAADEWGRSKSEASAAGERSMLLISSTTAYDGTLTATSGTRMCCPAVYAMKITAEKSAAMAQGAVLP
eukprot:7384342-Prymnesium_polylepis.2